MTRPDCKTCMYESPENCPTHSEGLTLHTRDGEKIIESSFIILHKGWEMDNHGWVTKDGLVYTTTHGGTPYHMGQPEIEKHIAETASSLTGLRAALAVAVGLNFEEVGTQEEPDAMG